MKKFNFVLIKIAALFVFGAGVFGSVENARAQTKKPTTKKPASTKTSGVKLPKVTQIDAEALKKILTPNGKPLLINFWATWCDPCREEFPDLVKIASDYQGKIDLITISLDELSELNREVPQFLAEMKSESPAYLLKTPDEGAAIAFVSKDWQGGLPFTIFLSATGETIYSKQGKFKTDVLRAEIDKALATTNSASNSEIIELPKSTFSSDLNYEKGKTDAIKDIAQGRLIIRRYGFSPGISTESSNESKGKHNVQYFDYGCIVTPNLIDYVKGYNEISRAEIKRKYGDKMF